jgi:hypothetical protein
LIIVCWHHGNIPDLAFALKVPEGQITNAMGMQGMHWAPKVFDSFWSVTFVNQTATLTINKQPPVPGS